MVDKHNNVYEGNRDILMHLRLLAIAAHFPFNESCKCCSENMVKIYCYTLTKNLPLHSDRLFLKSVEYLFCIRKANLSRHIFYLRCRTNAFAGQLTDVVLAFAAKFSYDFVLSECS